MSVVQMQHLKTNKRNPAQLTAKSTEMKMLRASSKERNKEGLSHLQSTKGLGECHELPGRFECSPDIKYILMHSSLDTIAFCTENTL